VAEYLLDAPPNGPVTVTETDAHGAPQADIPAQVDGKTLLFLLPGITEPSSVRYFRVAWGNGKSKIESRKSKTDLWACETDGGLQVRNTYFTVTHPTRGQGGFPTKIRFNLSGAEDTRFVFEDRLFAKEEGYFTLRADPESTARIISTGPLRAVVETQACYTGGQPARGHARATYRWVYRAFSPVVEVTMQAERDDDFAWGELHFLQISRKDQVFDRWAGGEPLQTGRFVDARKGYSLPGWAVMYNADDAIGLACDGSISLFDGISEYYNYVQFTTGPWAARTFEKTARVYLGPACRPAEFAPWLGPPVRFAVRPVTPPFGGGGISSSLIPPPPGRYTLRNEEMTLRFASEREGLGLVGLTGGDHEFLRPTNAPALLWRLVFRDAQGETVTVDNTGTPGVFQRRREGEQTVGELRWRDVPLGTPPPAPPSEGGEGGGTLDVRVTVELAGGSETSLWRIYVDNRSERYGLWEVHFPVFGSLPPPGAADVAVPRSNWGYLYRKLEGGQGGSYPSANWPIQMLTVNEGESGLYLAAHDPGAYPKQFSYQPGGTFHFLTYPGGMGVPGSDFDAPFPVAVGVYQGDWWVGAKRYRQWALAHAPWTKRGPLTERGDVPAKVKHLGLWMLGGGFRDEVVPNMLRAQEFFGVPLGLHWYNWHEIPFDVHYPNYFPPKPGFAEGVGELTERGMIAMPYINGRLWDQANENWAEARPFAAQPWDGENYTEVYGSGAKLAPMCPATRFWQDKVNEIVGRLIRECGVNAIYIDQIAAAGPQLCFNPGHGHPLGGGTHWVDGYRELLRRVKEQAAGKVGITSENNAEPYMDGVDEFLIWNPRHEDEIPLMTAVYSGYTLYFASPVTLDTGDLSFCMAQGRDFVWGCQLGWMGFDLLDEAHRAKAEYLRTLGQYRAVAHKFLVEGELLGELRPDEPVPEVHGTWNSWSATWPAATPAVMGTIWRAPDGTLGLVMTNVDDQPHPFTYTFDARKWGPMRYAGHDAHTYLVTRLTPRGSMPTGFYGSPPLKSGEGAFTRTEVLQPREVRVLEVGGAAQYEQETLRTVYAQARLLAEGRTPRRVPEQLTLDDVDILLRKLQLPPDEPLAQAAWEIVRQLKVRKYGLSWSLEPRQVQVAEGDDYTLTLRARNAGEKTVQLRLQLEGEGWRQPLVVWPGREATETLTFRAPRQPGATLRRGTLWFSPTEPRPVVPGAPYLGPLTPWEEIATVAVPVTVVPPLTAELTVETPPRAGESVLLRVLVGNHSAQPLSPRLRLRVPEDWSLEPGRTLEVPDLAPGEARTCLFQCAIPPEAEVGRARLGVEIVQGVASETIEVAPPRPRAEARRCTPTIDGDLAEWRDQEPVKLAENAAAHLEGWSGLADCSAQVWLGWDEAHCYLAAEVTDNVFRQPHVHREMWQGDCLQLAFRPALKRTAGYDEEVVEFGLALTPEGPELWEWMPAERTVTEGQAQIKPTDRGLIYEAAIPWTALGSYRPTAGGKLTGSFTVNDHDGEKFRGWLEWTPGICGGKDASAFGWVELQGN